MLKTISMIALLVSAVSASATSYNVQLGQSVDLQAGDVALVRSGGAISAITCNGGGIPTLPPRQQFEIAREARFMDLFQTGADINREIQCSASSADQGIRQAVADALNAARETCFQTGYGNCAQPMRTDEQYSFHVRGFPGQYTCLVVARIVGTNPN